MFFYFRGGGQMTTSADAQVTSSLYVYFSLKYVELWIFMEVILNNWSFEKNSETRLFPSQDTGVTCRWHPFSEKMKPYFKKSSSTKCS